MELTVLLLVLQLFIVFQRIEGKIDLTISNLNLQVEV